MEVSKLRALSRDREAPLIDDGPAAVSWSICLAMPASLLKDSEVALREGWGQHSNLTRSVVEHFDENDSPSTASNC
jgi:hypothetical protein